MLRICAHQCKMVCTRRGGRPCPPGGTHPQNGRANANTHHVCRGRCPPRPARCTSVFTIRCGKPAIAQRADRGVRPYGCVRVRRGAREVATVYRAGGVEPRPYGNGGRFCGFALVRSNLRVRTEQSFRHGCAVPPPFTQGRLWCGQNAQQLKNKNPSPHQSASPTASPRGEAIYKKCLTFLKMRI